MTNAEVLEKAIAQAVENGWDYPYYTKDFHVHDEPDPNQDGRHEVWVIWGKDERETYPNENNAPDIIFRHDFAKAFWGEELACEFCGEEAYNGTNEEGEEYWQCDGEESHSDWGEAEQKQYQYHLQQQVISDDPIQYLQKGLK